MLAPTLSCEAASRLMPQYTVGMLEDVQADGLVRHALVCPHCRRTLWDPFQAQLNDSACALAEAVGDFDRSPPESQATQPLSWNQSAARTWTDLPLATAADVHALVRSVLTGTGDLAAAPGIEPITRVAPRKPAERPAVEFWLERIGVYLPRIPHPERIMGYVQCLMSDGKVRAGVPPGGHSVELARLTVLERPSIELQTAGDAVVCFTLEARVPGLELDGAPLRTGEALSLGGYHTLEGQGQAFTLHLGGSDLPQTLGRIETLPERIPLTAGDPVIGRDPLAEIPLPDGTPILPIHHLLLRPGVAWSAVKGVSLENLEVSRRHARLNVPHPAARRQEVQGNGVSVSALSERPLWHHGPSGWRPYAVGSAPFELKLGEILVVGRQCFRLAAHSHP